MAVGFSVSRNIFYSEVNNFGSRFNKGQMEALNKTAVIGNLIGENGENGSHYKSWGLGGGSARNLIANSVWVGKSRDVSYSPSNHVILLA